MNTARILAISLLAVGPTVVTSADAQPAVERTVEQYQCKDILREGGSNRDVAIAFLHGFLLGKSGTSKFNLEVLQKQTDSFIDRCLENPSEKASDAMMKVKG